MRRRKEIVGLVIGLALIICALPGTCAAGVLTLVGEGSISADTPTETEGVYLIKGTYKIENQGDEAAKEVFPKLEVGMWKWAGEPVKLEQGKSHTWTIESKIRGEQLICKTDQTCMGVELPIRGAFPLRITRYYQDQNGYQFSAPEVAKLIVGETSEEERARLRAPSMTAKMEVDGNGQQFDAEVQIVSRAPKAVTLAVSFVTSDEFKVINYLSKVEAQPVQDAVARAQAHNFSGLTGSSYPLFALIQWDDGGVRNFMFRVVQIELKPRDNAELYVALSAGTVAFILVILLYVLLRKPSKKRG